MRAIDMARYERAIDMARYEKLIWPGRGKLLIHFKPFIYKKAIDMAG